MALLSTVTLSASQVNLGLPNYEIYQLFFVDASQNDVSITLPAPSPDGLLLRFKRLDVNEYTLCYLVAPPGALIAGRNQIQLSALPSAALIAQGGNWHVL